MSERHLAAIMFTDIVGYTALMGSDEDKAFQVLRQNRGIQQSMIKKYHGKWLKEMGDGILAQFNSAADAARCAIQIQEQARKELKSQIRIGIHLGDITFENEDVFGDGVNLASRLQSIADPGGIYISESLQNAIRAKSDIQAKYLGAFNLKNVDYPVKTYSIQGDGLPMPSTAKIKALEGKTLKDRIFGSAITYLILLLLLVSGLWWGRTNFLSEKSTISSLVFLPFDNFTGSDTLDYLMAGMHDALIGDAGKIGALRIPSRTTANVYHDTEKSIPEIASELNVDGAVETSVSCFDDNVCFQVRLVSAFPEEELLWEKEFSVEMSQIPNLFRRVAKEISNELNVTLSSKEESLLAESNPVDPEAYDAYLKGQFYWEKLDRDFMQRSLDYFQLAIAKDPEWADPYAGLANAWGMFATFFKILPKSVTLPKVYQYMNKALELDPKSAKAHYVKALVAVWTEFDWVQGEEEFLTSLELNPNDALCRMYYSHLLMILNRSDEAVKQANLALELDPMKPLILWLYGGVMRKEGNEKLAIDHYNKALSIDPDFRFAKHGLSNIRMRKAYNQGDFETWITSWDQKVEADGRWNKEGRASVLNAFYEKGHLAAIEEMLKMNEKYGNACYISGDLKAERYIKLKNYDKAMDCLEQGYENRDMFMTYIRTELDLRDQLKDNPRYIELLKNMNLPLE